MKEIVESHQQTNWIFHGQIEQSQLIKFISNSDVAVQPSLQEGLSMVIPQILSCGVPVIATTNTGGEDLISNGINGYIVPIRDSIAISEKIELLFNDNDKLTQLKNNTTNVKELSWNEYGNRYVNFLNKISNH